MHDTQVTIGEGVCAMGVLSVGRKRPRLATSCGCDCPRFERELYVRSNAVLLITCIIHQHLRFEQSVSLSLSTFSLSLSHSPIASGLGREQKACIDASDVHVYEILLTPSFSQSLCFTEEKKPVLTLCEPYNNVLTRHDQVHDTKLGSEFHVRL